MKIIFLIIVAFLPFVSYSQTTLEGSMRLTQNTTAVYDGSHVALSKNAEIILYTLDGQMSPTLVEWKSTGLSHHPFKLINGFYLEKPSNQYQIKSLDSTEPVITLDNLMVWNASGAVGRTEDSNGRKGSVVYLDSTMRKIAVLSDAKYDDLFGNSETKSDGLSTMRSVLMNSNITKDYLPFSEGLTPIKDFEKKFGYMDSTLQLVISPQFVEATPFYEGFAAVKNDKGLWGFIDRSGAIVIPCEYTRKPLRFTNGLARVQSRDGKYGYIDKSNQVIISPQFKSATVFYKGHALVRGVGNTSTLQLIDTKGAVLAEFDHKYTFVDEFTEVPDHYPTASFSPTLIQLVDYKKAIFTQGSSQYGFMDIEGNELISFDFKIIKDYHDGLMLAQKTQFINGKTNYTNGIINEKGEFVYLFVESEF
ncbi:WG repeat-containing protein [Algoriphagus sp.]|uniref:WG repeat-containing protein n=1 Tax=Algoriphagus sp. TaxID=1872435 RepID=UPI003F72B5D3